MGTYELLKTLHTMLALISGLGFALRGFIRLVLNRPLAHPLVRFGPHIIDTLLLASGVGLWWITRYAPWLQGWFGLKLFLVLVYIALGIAAFRARSRNGAVGLYLMALFCFLAIGGLALFKPFQEILK